MSESVGVVLPIYNEGVAVVETLASLRRFTDEHPEFRFWLVDDGSPDGTGEVLQNELKRVPKPAIGGICLAENQGKGGAVAEGFRQAEGELLIFTDGDLAYPLEDLLRIREALRTSDVVIGSRAVPGADARKVMWRRRVLGETFNRLVRLGLQLPFHDTQAGIKGFRREAAERLFPKLRTHGFAFDVELLVIAQRLGLRVGEIPVTPRKEHVYKKSKLKLFKDSWRMFLELVRMRWNRARGFYDD
jgi:glycosyltransferase involved in cell wall biosynthesis